MKKINIVYDNIIYSLQKAGGISKYWTELIKRQKGNIVFYELENQNIFRNSLKISTLKESKIPLLVLRYLPFLKKITSNSIFHSSYYRTTFQKNVTIITTVHDFTYNYFAKGLPRLLHNYQKNLAIKNSDGIICISNNTKKELLKFFPLINKEKVKTIYNGVDNSFFQIKNLKNNIPRDLKFLFKKKIILYIGERSAVYKNFSLVLDIVKSLDSYHLVCIGGGNLKKEEKKNIDKKVKNRFYHIDEISTNKLNIIYNMSFCLLYPSSHEGFGIPIIESMKAGCPVISTNKSSIPEISGDAAILVNRINKKKFIQSIKLLQNKNLRDKYINKGLKQAQKFSWDKCFKETLKFYSVVHKKKCEKLI
jgi:glycosyltransferase involved in cell wall biosynthesis